MEKCKNHTWDIIDGKRCLDCFIHRSEAKLDKLVDNLKTLAALLIIPAFIALGIIIEARINN